MLTIIKHKSLWLTMIPLYGVVSDWFFLLLLYTQMLDMVVYIVYTTYYQLQILVCTNGSLQE